ncbi:10002_t:CDS:2 [Gigaspora margarita]|uniref:10002_t:CDS:1 n=1 Tax=Gigaspora margarita TaxID=4874 RepID=A0ABN7UJA3_GIGMA|nr:10002_t:CDS:2 [Gigaspora margarita]
MGNDQKNWKYFYNDLYDEKRFRSTSNLLIDEFEVFQLNQACIYNEKFISTIRV